MTFRKSLTTLAAVALVAFAVSMAQAGNCGTPCPSKAQAGGCQSQMTAPGCQGQAQKAECCKGLPPAQCCKSKMGHGGKCGGACDGTMQHNCDGSCGKMAKQGCGSSCTQMMKRDCSGSCDKMMMRGCGDSCEMDRGCKWECNGIWGDYDCSNPGGRSLLNCCSKMHRRECRMIVIRGDGECGDKDCMSMPEMGCGKDGRRMIFIERHEGGMGEKECQVRVMQHKCDANCKEQGCPMMKQGAGAPPCGGAPPAQAPQGGCPHSGK